MKQIIPFQKELLFKTKVSEITSISLEHNLSLKEDHLIKGEFQISGDYKMTEGSINRENFCFNLPFEIEIDDNYEDSSIIVDIDNFYYELINNESLKVNIDVFIEGNKKEEIIDVEPIEEKTEREEPTIEEQNIEEDITYEKPEKIIIEEPDKKEEFNIFDGLDNTDTYVTYHIYIVKENDTIDKIIDHYKVTKEDIALYNNLEDIKPGTKLIIPNRNE